MRVHAYQQVSLIIEPFHPVKGRGHSAWNVIASFEGTGRNSELLDKDERVDRCL
jgi:hypothetical protein